MLGLSYLSPNIFLPWLNALQDLFAIFALIILVSKQSYRKDIEIDERVIYVFGLIALIPLVQYLFGLLFFTQELVLSLIYISAFFLSIISGINLTKSFKEIEKISFSFIFISLSCVLLQLIQWSNIYHSALLLDSSSRRPFANIGQPNNLATLLFIGFFSNILLFKNNKIKIYLYLLVSATLMTGIVLTQSRTSWLVFIAVLFITFLKKKLNLFSTMLKSSIAFLFLVLTLPYITLFFHDQGLTVIERISSDSSRLYIWKQMLIAIIDKPWFGYGWNQTSVAQTSVTLKYPLNIWLEYSHNLFLDIIVWTGIPIGISIITIIIIWFLQTFKKINTPNQLIYFLIITAFFIHCMLEFPFAYAYFLLPVGLYVGILHQQVYETKNSKVKGLVMTIVTVLIVAVIIISRDYFLFNNKRTIYASKNLFSQQIQPISSKILLLNALDINNDILFLDECYVLKNNKFKVLRNSFYRYPTNKNLITYYKSAIYNNQNTQYPEKYMQKEYSNFKSSPAIYNNCSKL
ncbi:PglL family O-oligosaccharyltransferase [Psychrobacter sp. ANT_H59]|uniref:PglL family O-oligosaccharyltransferase n=1 Tax=Psychrobacter sp. ANT_H59 TaxID=2597354 RepID=UPI00165D4827|nr:O-antigen ligase family protein [Psychrobacter sp. ANT_H59]